jgi:hypothetical protein
MRRRAAFSIVLACAGSVRADEARPSEPLVPRAEPTSGQAVERAATLFHIGVGLLAMPAASFCPSPTAPCRPGETSVAVPLMALVRVGELAFGAGSNVAFGLRPERGAGEAGRNHTRNYFSFDAIFRYYLPRLRQLDWWVGGSIGAVVVSDLWTTELDRAPYSDAYFVGPKRLTLRSEGVSLGPSIGAHWRFSERWLVGTQFRYANWFFSGERPQTPLGDSASLAGRVDVLDFGVLLGFRVGL